MPWTGPRPEWAATEERTCRDGGISTQVSTAIEGVVSFRNDLMCGPLTDLFTRLCTISADTSQVTRQSKKGTIGEYYIQDFEIVLLCGLTELQAQLRWFEKASEDRENLYLLSCFADARIGGGEERAG